jgi:hypothetical protein
MNDLIGLRYGWGHRPGDDSGMTDCFQLMCEVQRRLGLRDYGPAFEWVYGKYTEDTLPRLSIMRWLLTHCDKLTDPKPGAIALLHGTKAGALATVTQHGLILLAPSQNVVHTSSPPPTAWHFWAHQ